MGASSPWGLRCPSINRSALISSLRGGERGPGGGANLGPGRIARSEGGGGLLVDRGFTEGGGLAVGGWVGPTVVTMGTVEDGAVGGRVRLTVGTMGTVEDGDSLGESSGSQ